MKYGFTIPGSGPLTDPDAMSAVAKRGEELGYDIVVVPDHIILPRDIDSVYPYAQDGIHPGTRTGSCLEQLTVLAFIAGQTSRIRIGTSVMIVPHRNPFVAAKALQSERFRIGGLAQWPRTLQRQSRPGRCRRTALSGHGRDRTTDGLCRGGRLERRRSVPGGQLDGGFRRESLARRLVEHQRWHVWRTNFTPLAAKSISVMRSII